MMKKLGLVMLSLIVMSACTTSSITKLSATSGSLTFAQAASLDPDLVKSVNTLAFLLQDKQSTENQFISSLSIYIALAMTAHGTASTSYDQFMGLLNPLGLTETQWMNQLKTLQGNLNAAEKVEIALSNSLWIRDTFADKVKADFLNRNKDYFGAMIASADFNKPQAIDDINDWVKKNTNNLIDKVIDSIDPSTIMFLINTIYFKGSWASPFEAGSTRDGIFHGSSDKTVKFMNQTAHYKYAETSDYQAVMMPYEGNKFGMLIVMGKSDPDQIDSELAFQNIMNSLETANVKVVMPKVDITTSLVLNDKLSALGLRDPFIPNVADFSRLSDADLYISKILHKTHLKIDEKGTEAAAATVVIIDVTSVPVVDHEMIIDHPFQIYIVDLENNLILFSGLLKDVTE